MRGIDVSGHQHGLVVSNLDVDFVIAKATEGVGYTDPDCDRFIQQAITSRKSFGFYHFARENSPEDEAVWFVHECMNYFGCGIPVLDYETENANNVEWCERFISKVHELTGIWCMIYMSAYRLSQYANSWMPSKCGLWLAGYPTSYTSWTDDNMPYSPSPWQFAAIWQFTSSLRLQGWNSNLDGDIAYMDALAWMRYAACDASQDNIKTTDDLAIETILGEYGTGDDRKKMLGDRYDDVQTRVNEYYARACEVWDGKWGNGWNRRTALEGAGYNPDIVQKIVNETEVR